MTLYAPAPNATLNGSSVEVRAHVVSSHPVTGVVATIGPVTKSLVEDIFVPTTWRHFIDSFMVPSGPQVLRVTATNSMAEEHYVEIPVVVDQLPVVTVTSPLTGSLANPFVTVDAQCTDLEGGCSIVVSTGPTVLATGASPFHQLLDLSAFEDETVPLTVAALDSIGQGDGELVYVHVESDPCVDVATIAPGIVDTWDATRVIYTNASETGIYDRATDAVLATLPWNDAYDAYLTPVGAIFGRGGRIYDLRHDGTLHDRGPWRGLHANGDFASWIGLPEMPTQAHVWDFSTDTFENHDAGFGEDPRRTAMTTDGHLFVTKLLGTTWPVSHIAPDGTLTNLATGHNGASNVIAGEGVAVWEDVDFLSDTTRLHMWTAAGGHATLDTRDWTLPQGGLAAKGGWIAYGKFHGGQVRAFRRSPTGIEEQIGLGAP